MNTPAHLIFAATAFGKPARPAVTAAALFGALLPDLSLYLMAGFSLYVLGYSGGYVFDVLYYSDAWQRVFSVDNSFVLWGAGLAAALYYRSAWAIALTGGALLHLALDFPFHTHDARAHFWPLTDWKFHSPLSYWDPNAGGRVISIIENIAVLLCTLLLLYRFKTWRPRALFTALLAMQILPAFVWYFLF